MNSGHEGWVLLVGVAVVLAAAVQALAHRARIPGMVGFLALGVGLRMVEDRWHLLGDTGSQAFGLLADLGIVVLLFHVGLRSDIAGLRRKLGPAALIWIGDVSVAALFGYLAARHLAGLDVGAAATVAVARSATSVSVSAAVWEEAKALRSPNGELLIDVAELDDISGVALMAMLFAVAPMLSGGGPLLAMPLYGTVALFIAKFAAFAAACFVLAAYIEPRITHAIARLERAPQRMLTVVGAGFVIAALAAVLGFSLAIGALFAGLVFSRDPAAIRTEARLDDLYAFLVPFFFIGVGMQIDLHALGEGLGAGLWLLMAAVAGKLIGDGVPALMLVGSSGAALIATSMVPRAEIAMIIAQQGRTAGLLPETAYAALVFVSAATCLAMPWLIRALLKRWPQGARMRKPEPRR